VYNFVKLEVWYPSFGVGTLKRSTVSVYASVLLKKNLNFEVLFPCFRTAVLRNNSPKVRKNLRFQKYIWNFRFFLPNFGNLSFFQKIFIPKFRKMIRTSWKFPKIQLQIVAVSQTRSLYLLCTFSNYYSRTDSIFQTYYGFDDPAHYR
jgi:hypothetical protein